MGITKRIIESVKEFFVDFVMVFIESMFSEFNNRIAGVAGTVGQTPENWNAQVFNLVRNLSETVIVPIAGIVITYVLCYELITMLMEKNNMHDVDSFQMFKSMFKASIGILLLSNAFTITMGIFDLGQYVVNQSAGYISSPGALDMSGQLEAIKEALMEMSVPEICFIMLLVALLGLVQLVAAVAIFWVTYSRMIEIYLLISVAPIPFATITNREWGRMGKSYAMQLVSLAFQGFFIILCVGIYNTLVSTTVLSFGAGEGFLGTFTTVSGEFLSFGAYSIVVVLMLLKTGSISRSIFGQI